MALTTLKVPTELRDRIASEAQAQHVTIAGFLDQVIDEWEHRRRMESVGRAMRDNPPDADYWSEFAEFDAIGGGTDS
ncbi:hypothetical protein [Ruania alba]|nr:hypothetical protein [Ruania alba]